jgi:hypothetical protein
MAKRADSQWSVVNGPLPSECLWFLGFWFLVLSQVGSYQGWLPFFVAADSHSKHIKLLLPLMIGD